MSPSLSVMVADFSPAEISRGLGWGNIDSSHYAKRPGRGLGIKHNPCLLQNPSLNFFVVNTQQVYRAANVVLLSNPLGCMALNLRAYSAGYVEPFAQTGERTAQPVQGQFQPGSGACLSVRNAWLCEPT